jgi:hypothetical protein
MKRLYTVTAIAVTSLGLLLGGCGADRNPAPTGDQPDRGPAVEVDGTLGVDAQALIALGYEDADVTVPAALTDPAPAPSASSGRDRGANADRRRERRQGRVMLRRNTLHGEAVVQTDAGPQTVVVQRGAVTAVNGDTFTVTSTDGFVLTWTFGPEAKIVKDRAKVGKDQIKAGDQVGVAGAKSGDKTVARLVVVPKPK